MVSSFSRRLAWTCLLLLTTLLLTLTSAESRWGEGRYYYDSRGCQYYYGQSGVRVYNDRNCNERRSYRHHPGYEVANYRYPSRDREFQGRGYAEVRGRDAELSCRFPGSDLVSNIIWERVADQRFDHRTLYAPNRLYNQVEVVSMPNYSRLRIKNFDYQDEGIYHCIGNRERRVRYGDYRVESVYMEVSFRP
ncbi:uncharacterized protein LOC143032449 [Oratosquilla oratoria]|uniref:uncharacterized protein LOC143032449 n=1 Tax=Oratosquilla oratoria TaxID=337810 RepID=UPI003F75F7EC